MLTGRRARRFVLFLQEAEQEVKLRSVELEESQALASETKAQLLATADQLAATEQDLTHRYAPIGT